MTYQFETFEVDDREFRLLESGMPVQVEPKVLRLLLYLIENYLSDGRLISVLKDYRADDAKGRFLHAAHDSACLVFGHTLGPDFNSDHKDHFHLDMGFWGPCR